jgi:predicted signal transduction protein with EAL and GGDEF domain
VIDWDPGTASRSSGEARALGRGRLTERAHNHIRDGILRGDLPVGSVLAEGKIAEGLGHSRTPVRQALSLLLQEGLVEVGPRRQLLVRGFTAEHRLELLALREALESVAVRRACEVMTVDEIDYLRLLLMRQRRAADLGREDDFIERDEEFHLRIAEGARFPVLVRFLGQLRGFVRVMRLGTVRHASEVARRLNEVVRPSDTLARLGGDEFALLLEGANELSAVSIARRVLECLAEPIFVAGHQLALGASIGIAVHTGGPGESEDLIRHADVAMYAAKEAGRGRYEVFRLAMARELGELLGLEHELRLGLQRGEFSVHYQRAVDVETHSTVGVEALLRWRSPARGDVAPSQFIPVAEATGLIHPLGELVLGEACRQTAEWLRADLLPESFVVWVNLSGRQLSRGGMDVLVRETLDVAGLPPRFLGLEVTETSIVVEGPAGDRARAELEDLHREGVRIAIDDFGTGFSSLGQLRRFPVDLIKVDRSFVQGVEHDAKDAAITANLVSLAHALGLLAIAEGIETKGQLTSVQELGCDHAQGFLFAHPLPADEMSRALAADATSARGADAA